MKINQLMAAPEEVFRRENKALIKRSLKRRDQKEEASITKRISCLKKNSSPKITIMLRKKKRPRKRKEAEEMEELFKQQFQRNKSKSNPATDSQLSRIIDLLAILHFA